MKWMRSITGRESSIGKGSKLETMGLFGVLQVPLFLFLAEIPFPRDDRENVSKKCKSFFSLLDIRENVSNNSNSSSNSDDDDDDNE